MKKLKWAETPFDRMKPDELLLQAKRMYDAIVSARSVIRMHQLENPDQPYWTSPRGTGGNALDKCNQIVEPLEKEYGSEQIFRSFYRTATDLLWNCEHFDHGTGWAVCSKCGLMLGAQLDKDSMRRLPNDRIGKKCSEACHGLSKDCDGIMEKLDWKHLVIAAYKK